MHKFTRRQVSSELNYLEMYNIYTMCQVTSKQQVSQINAFWFVFFLISWLCSLSFEARIWVSNYSGKLEKNIIERVSVA